MFLSYLAMMSHTDMKALSYLWNFAYGSMDMMSLLNSIDKHRCQGRSALNRSHNHCALVLQIFKVHRKRCAISHRLSQYQIIESGQFLIHLFNHKRLQHQHCNIYFINHSLYRLVKLKICFHLF